eukprot:763431-Karenia_brevis.AAC.1
MKAKFIRSAAHSKGFYGCEASHVDEAGIQHYISEVAKVIGTSNSMHSKALVYALSGFGIDMHPEVAIFGRRVAMIRRTVALRPDT